MKDNLALKLHLLIKKIKDKSLKWKIKIFLFCITVMTCAAIGSYSYFITRDELLTNSKAAVINLVKQGGQTLDDKVNVFRDVSYQMLQSAQLSKIINYTEEEANRYRTANEGLPSVIAQQEMISKYIEYAFLKPASGTIYHYYHSDQKKLGAAQEQELIDYLDAFVDKHHVTEWLEYEGQLFFVRQIIDSSTLQEKGILCFAVHPDFLEFVSTDIEYLNNDNVIVLGSGGAVLKNSHNELSAEILRTVNQNAEQNYYIYSMLMNHENEQYTVFVLNTLRNDWTIVCFFSHQVLFEGINHIFRAILEIILLAAVLIIFITGLISRTITRNVTLIEEGMKQYEQGRFDYRISPDSYDEIGHLGLQLNYMALQISNLIEQLKQEEEKKKRMEIETLQAQINPHFLYNTLGSLQWAAYKKNEKETASSISALSNLLRFTIKRAGKMVTVSEEIDYIKNYISVEKVKYGDGIDIDYEIEEKLAAHRIPGFVLQPIIENSLIHGIDMAEKTGQIVVSVYSNDGYLCMEVSDNGIGMEEERIQQLLSFDEQKNAYKGFNSIGIEIVNKRLKQIYGEAYQTIIVSKPGEGTTVTLKIPLPEGGNGNEVERFNH